MNDPYHIPGVILLDGFSHSFAQGIILTQAFKYLDDFGDDSCRKRVFVMGVVLLATLQTVSEDYKVWRLTINQDWWSNRLQWFDIFLDGLICWLCEAFFIWRCWKITNKNTWILLPLCLLSLSTLVANVYLATVVHKVATPPRGQDNSMFTPDLLPSTIFAFSYWTFGSLVLDLSITSVLILSLWRSRTGLVKSDRVLYHIIAISWESATMPSIFMLTAVSIYHANPINPNYHLIRFLLLVTGKLYTIGLLRTLNSRVKLREKLEFQNLGRVSLRDWQFEPASDVNNIQITRELPGHAPPSLSSPNETRSAPLVTRSCSLASKAGATSCEGRPSSPRCARGSGDE